MMRTDLPWSVADPIGATNPGDRYPVIGRFATHDDAARYISTLPDHETGRYELCGPPD